MAISTFMTNSTDQSLPVERRANLSDELSDLYRATPLGMALFTPDYHVVRMNKLHGSIFGVSPGAVVGKSIFDYASDRADAMSDFIDRVVASGEPEQQVRTQSRAEGEDSQTLNTHWYPVFDADGAVRAVGAVTEDITEVEKRERVLKHIARELQHRVKNTLANVIALVEQAERSAGEREDVLAILKRRVLALSHTHARLTEANWGPTPLRDLLEQEMTGVYGDEAIALDGPDILLTAQSALAFAMALHEMTANAATYGALSRAGGAISLSWRIDRGGEDGGRIDFEWRESGGPPIEEPARKGFGHRLIDASLRTSLRGQMEREWSEEGLRYRFSLPLVLVTGS